MKLAGGFICVGLLIGIEEGPAHCGCYHSLGWAMRKLVEHQAT